MGIAANLTLIIIVAAIGVPALVYALISYFNQAGQNMRIDMEALSISQEKAARIAADNALTVQINQETTNRIAQDTIITNNVNVLNQTTINQIATTNSNLNVTNSNLNVTNMNIASINQTIVQTGILEAVVNTLNGGSGNLTINGTSPIGVLTVNGSGIFVYLQNTTVIPGTYTDGAGGISFTVNAEGRLTFANASTQLNQTLTNLQNEINATNTTLNYLIANISTSIPSGVVPGFYNFPSFNVNVNGIITNASNNTFTLAGDVNGNLNANVVNNIQGRTITVNSSISCIAFITSPYTYQPKVPNCLQYNLDSNVYVVTQSGYFTTTPQATVSIIYQFVVPSKYVTDGLYSVMVTLTANLFDSQPQKNQRGASAFYVMNSFYYISGALTNYNQANSFGNLIYQANIGTPNSNNRGLIFYVLPFQNTLNVAIDPGNGDNAGNLNSTVSFEAKFIISSFSA